MGKRDPRVDAYIAKAPAFAKPILERLRAVVHTACPDAQETMKWSVPHFDYKGMMCGMASFKNYATFGFWKSTLVLDRDKIQDGAGQFGKLMSVGDLPSDKTLAAYIRKAAKLNDDGVRVAKGPKRQLPKPKTPPALAAALKKNKKAQVAWTALSPSHVREYVEWITEAKGDDTRARRIATTIEWLSEGKSRNWKYMKK